MIEVASSSLGDFKGMCRDTGFLIQGHLFTNREATSTGDGLMRPPLSEEKKSQTDAAVFPGRRIISLEDVLHASFMPRQGSRLELSLFQEAVEASVQQKSSGHHPPAAANFTAWNIPSPAAQYLVNTPVPRGTPLIIPYSMYAFSGGRRVSHAKIEPLAFAPLEDAWQRPYTGIQETYGPLESRNQGYINRRASFQNMHLFSGFIPIHWQKVFGYGIGLSDKNKSDTKTTQNEYTFHPLSYQGKKQATMPPLQAATAPFSYAQTVPRKEIVLKSGGKPITPVILYTLPEQCRHPAHPRGEEHGSPKSRIHAKPSYARPSIIVQNGRNVPSQTYAVPLLSSLPVQKTRNQTPLSIQKKDDPRPMRLPVETRPKGERHYIPLSSLWKMAGDQRTAPLSKAYVPPSVQMPKPDPYQGQRRDSDISLIVGQPSITPNPSRMYAIKKSSVGHMTPKNGNDYARAPYGAGFSLQRLAEMSSRAQLMRDSFGAEFTYSIRNRLTGSVVEEGGRKPVPPASAIKAALIYAVLYLSHRGEINLKEVVTPEYVEALKREGKLFTHEKAPSLEKELGIEAMLPHVGQYLTGLSNRDSNILLSKLGYERINAVLHSLGYTDTRFADHNPFRRGGSYRRNRSSAGDLTRMMDDALSGKHLDSYHRSLFMNALDGTGKAAEQGRRADTGWFYFFTKQQHDSLGNDGIALDNVLIKPGRTEHETGLTFRLQGTYLGKEFDYVGTVALSNTKDLLLKGNFKDGTAVGMQVTQKFYDFTRAIGQGIIESLKAPQGSITHYQNSAPKKS